MRHRPAPSRLSSGLAKEARVKGGGVGRAGGGLRNLNLKNVKEKVYYKVLDLSGSGRGESRGADACVRRSCARL